MKYLTQENANNLDFIKHILLQNGFSEIKNAIRLKSGSRSLAYYADNYIVRFPKAEIIWQTMKREKNDCGRMPRNRCIPKQKKTSYYFSLIFYEKKSAKLTKSG